MEQRRLQQHGWTYHTKQSQSEKDKYQVILLICGILKRYKWTYLQNRNSIIDIENKFMFTKGEKWGEGQIRRLELTDTK